MKSLKTITFKLTEGTAFDWDTQTRELSVFVGVVTELDGVPVKMLTPAVFNSRHYKDPRCSALDWIEKNKEQFLVR